MAVPGQLQFGTPPFRSWMGACAGEVVLGGGAVRLVSGVLTVGFACCVISTSFPSIAV